MFEFIFTSPIQIIDESKGKPIIVEATLLAEGVSKNGRLYTIEEMKNIAKQVVGKPVYYGVDPVTNEHVNPLRGHMNVPKVGEVIKAWFDETLKKVKAHIKIISESLKDKIRNLGISIGGYAKKLLRKIVNGKPVLQVIGAVIDHIQLIPANRPRGVEAAKVENIIQESFVFQNTDFLNKVEDILVNYHIEFDPKYIWEFEIRD